ncbi:hypothetical protein RxyAA322_26660 [Rubrobacter xylanophilus]|uniref:DUF3616 domain-containing protein n=1 Tax=Rubrobacter xylanophilus TaxID=49319 RepID=A0A510HLI0_9ACTN|nr:hypothetical protein [Rubrobacter xylanophilus]BBL80812.1 hypothetical protein RxyAA322_26660 [Rubrobacter xylanophilus]
MSPEDGLHQLELNLHPNEASGLLAIEDGGLLRFRGWDLGFWAVLDEGEIQDCIALIGHREGTGIGEGWEIERLRALPEGGRPKKTADAEAIARRGGLVYAFGSHFGRKDGPLQPKRGFVARFREDAVEPSGLEVGLEVYRESFRLHRLVNDALREGGPELMPLRDATRRAFVEATVRRGREEGKAWSGMVREGDYPLNFEGAAFREDGSLLLGLRFPTAADGRPVLVELEGVERLFEGALPEVRGFLVVDAVGRGGGMAGVRDLALTRGPEGEELHLVTGNVDSREGKSVLVRDYPEGKDTVATHFRCLLGEGSGHLTARFVREFPELPRVEGIAVSGDRFFYVTDEDEGVHLRSTRLLAG